MKLFGLLNIIIFWSESVLYFIECINQIDTMQYVLIKLIVISDCHGFAIYHNKLDESLLPGLIRYCLIISGCVPSWMTANKGLASISIQLAAATEGLFIGILSV